MIRRLDRKDLATCGQRLPRPEIELVDQASDYPFGRILVEVSQGYSLGIGSGFYPYVTSRECTPAQAVADLAMPTSSVRRIMMAIRTYPIRTGNGKGYSGPCYPDQKEIEWGEVGVEPEISSVSNRTRRVFTFSWTQFVRSLEATAPTDLFVNFLNYLFAGEGESFLTKVLTTYERVLGHEPQGVLLGYGPRVEDVEVLI